LLLDGKSGEAYNVGSDEVVSISQLAYLVRNLVSPDKPVCILGKAQAKHQLNRYVPDIAKIYYHLNLCPTITLKQAIVDATKVFQIRGKVAYMTA
jgi:dTDP-glucose 4,6-dehydratase